MTVNPKRERVRRCRMEEQLTRLASEFNRDIEAGIWKVGETLPSLNAFGERYAVGYPTARKFYEWLKAGGRIRTEPRRGAMLLAATASLPPGETLRQRGIAAVGWLEVSHPDAPFSSVGVALKSLEEECRRDSIPLVFHNLWSIGCRVGSTPDIPPLDGIRWKKILEGNPAGVMLLWVNFDSPETGAAVAASEIPVVGIQSVQPGISNLSVDEYGMAVRATEHLLELGHRKIGFLAYRTDESWMEQRLAGYLETLRRAGITPNPKWIERLPYVNDSRLPGLIREPGFAALDRLAGNCTALLCGSDAAGAMILDFGAVRGIPEAELPAFVTFGDRHCFRGYNMSAVSFGAELLGSTGARLLTARILNPDLPVSDERVIGNLYVRSSSRPRSPRRTILPATGSAKTTSAGCCVSNEKHLERVEQR